MVRIQIKGGVWKNSEDEILKVAVMKYGKNQWARISSLLVRKSAKQCKARWYEWLDPSIKKTEWTREEEEKLLHLAKIMPTQWRTIAPIVGRTAAQCLEHYEKLLDAAQERDGDYDASEDPRRLRPGEIDPNPEARPARPDTVDMDEDEKEMLSEARARLANTKGKKAKRKAREKQLEEARRLASLQKKRELRAAGIEVRQYKRKRRGIDYNEEIPFEKRPAPGFFDTTKDHQRTVDLKNDPNFYNNVDLRELEGKRRDEEEERERKKDAKRQKLHRKTDLPSHLLQINKMNDPEFIQRRGNLSLPAPQISDSELHEIAKLGGVVAAPPVGVGGAGATRTLLASYGGTPAMATPMRTPRTPMGRDVLMEEAQNLIALTQQQTPLKGGENVILNPTDFGGITPRNRSLATPNSLSDVTPSRTPASILARGDVTPAATPFRDGLNINEGLSAEEAIHLGKKRSKRRRDAFKQQLATGLGALPAATNEYMLVKPELPPEVEETVSAEGDWEEDAEDALAKMEAQAKVIEEAILRKRHLAIQYNLPRPKALNVAMGNVDNEEGEVEGEVQELLRREMVAMLRYDAYQYPVEEDKGQKKQKKQKSVPTLPMFEEEEIHAAKEMIEEELCNTNNPLKGKNANESNGGIDMSDSDDENVIPSVSANFLGRLWEAVNSDFAFLPSERKYGQLSGVSNEQKIEAHKQEFTLTREQVLKDNKKAGKLAQRLNILTGGYRQVARQGAAQLESTWNTLGQCLQEKSCFNLLHSLELRAVPQRVAILKKEVATLNQKETELQAKYAHLIKERERLLSLLSAPAPPAAVAAK